MSTESTQRHQQAAGGKSKSIDSDVMELSEASKHLKRKVIHDLVTMLDDLQIIPIDSESLGQVMHTYGINMRYLSHVCVLTGVPHVKDLCVTEMLARTFKNIINTKLSELLLENKLEYVGLEKKRQELERETEKRAKESKYKNKQQPAKLQRSQSNDDDDENDPIFRDQELNVLKDMVADLMNSREQRDMNKKALKFIVDMLNLIFGVGEETDYFWEHMLFKECAEHFGIDEAIKY